VAGDAAYARRLEATLCERGLACQVINASVDGYTTAQEVAFLRERARALEIDIAVVGVYLGNDLLENLSPNGLAGWKRPLLSDRFLADPLHAELEAVPVTPGSPLRRCQDFLADHSRLYVVTGDLLKETGVIQRGLTSEGRAAAQSCGGCWNQLLWQHAELEGGARAATAKRTMVSSMLAAQRIAESAHEHLLFVLIPCRAQVAPALESDPRILAASEQLSRWQDEIVAELANRVALLDLLPAFRAAQVGGGGPLYFKLDWHLDERGHELAAREIADELGQRGWLK